MSSVLLYIAPSYELIKKNIESKDVALDEKMSVPQGVYANMNIPSGSILHVLKGNITNIPTKESIHIGDGYHITDDIGMYINHSFEPNVRVYGLKLIALRNINKNEEIRFNYNETEMAVANKFIVDDKEVTGNLKLDADIKKMYADNNRMIIEYNQLNNYI